MRIRSISRRKTLVKGILALFLGINVLGGIQSLVLPMRLSEHLESADGRLTYRSSWHVADRVPDIAHDCFGITVIGQRGYLYRPGVGLTSQTWITLSWAWPIGLACLALLSIALLQHCRRSKPTACPTCGYDLRATPDRCPECGTISSLA